MRKIYFLEDVEITYSYVDNPFNHELKNKEFKGLKLGKNPRVSVTNIIECSEGKRSCGHGGHGGDNERFQFKNNPEFELESYIYKGMPVFKETIKKHYTDYKAWRKIDLPNLSEKLIPGIYIGYLKSNIKENIDYFKNTIEPWKSDRYIASWTCPNLVVKYFPVFISQEGYTGEIKGSSRFYIGQQNLIEELENSIN